MALTAVELTEIQRRLGSDVTAHSNTAYVSDAEEQPATGGFRSAATDHHHCQITVAPVMSTTNA